MLFALLFVGRLQSVLNFRSGRKSGDQQLAMIDPWLPRQYNRKCESQAFFRDVAKNEGMGLAGSLFGNAQRYGESACVTCEPLNQEVGVPTCEESCQSIDLVSRYLSGLQIILHPERLGVEGAG
jgi:hypothetical protein